MAANQNVDVRTHVLTSRDRDYLERVVYNEARGEGVEGRNAVRAVILNRLASGRFGDTLEEVVNQKGQFEGVSKAGSVDKLPKAPPEYMNELAGFIKGGKDPTNGATFFLNPEIAQNKYNSGYKGTRVGNHVFYNHYDGNKVDVPAYRVVIQNTRVASASPQQVSTKAQEPTGKYDYIPDAIEVPVTKAINKAKSWLSDLTSDDEEPKQQPARRPLVQPQRRPADTNRQQQKKERSPWLPDWMPTLGFADGGTIQKGEEMAKMTKKGLAAPEAEAPLGALPEEVADDVPAMLSEGEYVLPADVVRWHGLKHIEEMRMEAKMGLMAMQMDGRLHEVDEEGEPVEAEEEEDDTEEMEDAGESEDETGLDIEIPEDWDSMEVGDGEVLILFKK